MNDSLTFRGIASVWGRDYYTYAMVLGSRFEISKDFITARVLGREHIHAKRDVVELRWIWLPWPELRVISRAGDDYLCSSLQVFRWSRLRSALMHCGYACPSEFRYYSSSLLRQDLGRYGLMKNFGSGGN